jgi:hypothetical protein
MAIRQALIERVADLRAARHLRPSGGAIDALEQWAERAERAVYLRSTQRTMIGLPDQPSLLAPAGPLIRACAPGRHPPAGHVAAIARLTDARQVAPTLLMLDDVRPLPVRPATAWLIVAVYPASASP